MNETQILREKVKDLKVLFVDDEKDIREGTGTFLKKFFNEVTLGTDGVEGLELFKNNTGFDVVISDVLMPNMDGITMAQEIKKIDPSMYIVFLTASKGVGKLVNKLSTSVFQKPLSFDDMKQIMKELGDLK